MINFVLYVQGMVGIYQVLADLCRSMSTYGICVTCIRYLLSIVEEREHQEQQIFQLMVCKLYMYMDMHVLRTLRLLIIAGFYYLANEHHFSACNQPVAAHAQSEVRFRFVVYYIPTSAESM